VSAPAYESYKDSGVEWLGQVPSHWEITRVKDVCTIQNGYPFDSKLFDPSNGHPLVRIRDIGADNAEVRYAGEPPEAYFITSAEVLVGMDGDFNVGRWNGQVEGLLNQRVCAIRTANSPLNKFLEFALPAPLKRINDLTYSTTVKHLSSYQVASIKLALPPGDELEKVVRFVSDETGKIDALIEAQTRLIELLKEKRQAVISHAVTKGLNPDAPMKDSGIEWLGQVPAHWEVARLKHVAIVQTGVAKGKDYGDQETEEVPFLRVANVQDGWVDLREVATIQLPKDDINRYRLQAGDVLMNEGGDYDKLGRGTVWQGQIDPCVHQNHVFAVRPQQVDPEWLDLVTSSQNAQFFFMGRSKQSTNLASISSTNLMELPLTVPPIVEMREIVGKVKAMLHDLTTAQSDIETGISFLQERRAALISAAVTGRIDVRGLVNVESEAA